MVNIGFSEDNKEAAMKGVNAGVDMDRLLSRKYNFTGRR
jgi:hypothetical protein